MLESAQAYKNIIKQHFILEYNSITAPDYDLSTWERDKITALSHTKIKSLCAQNYKALS